MDIWQKRTQAKDNWYANKEIMVTYIIAKCEIRTGFILPRQIFLERLPRGKSHADLTWLLMGFTQAEVAMQSWAGDDWLLAGVTLNRARETEHILSRKFHANVARVTEQQSAIMQGGIKSVHAGHNIFFSDWRHRFPIVARCNRPVIVTIKSEDTFALGDCTSYKYLSKLNPVTLGLGISVYALKQQLRLVDTRECGLLNTHNALIFMPAHYNRLRSVLVLTLLTFHLSEPGFIFPAGSLPDFCTCESCQTMLLIGGFSQDLPFPPPLHSGTASYSPDVGCQDLVRSCSNLVTSIFASYICINSITYIACEPIRFRVTAENFVETSPKGPETPESTSANEPPKEEAKIPYTLTGALSPGVTNQGNYMETTPYIAGRVGGMISRSNQPRKLPGDYTICYGEGVTNQGNYPETTPYVMGRVGGVISRSNQTRELSGDYTICYGRIGGMISRRVTNQGKCQETTPYVTGKVADMIIRSNQPKKLPGDYTICYREGVPNQGNYPETTPYVTRKVGGVNYRINQPRKLPRDFTVCYGECRRRDLQE
ncbi:hypothetical protein PR048_002113 [Dryococelus australis]|uniref:Uncharacterized protein n=1 Tax=Dryococelus australis TaxID=614101 RepID=A0ABQ9ILU2_9NEOP|nr:hypothetical protein PR048_002113 [Dryococelus australis]